MTEAPDEKPWTDFWKFPEDTWIPEELKDFKIYLHLLMRHLGMAGPTKRQLEAAEYVQNGPQCLMVMAYRGFGKSFICGAFITWVTLWWPEKKVLVISASEGHAINFTTVCRQYYKGFEPIQHLNPPTTSPRNSNTAFDLADIHPAQDPSVRAFGVMGQMAGAHGDIIVVDDMEIPNNSDTPGARLKLSVRSQEFAALANPGARQIVLGTPQSEQTAYAEFPDRGFEVRIWPSRYPQDTAFQLGELAPSILEELEATPALAYSGACEAFPGAPVDPERYGEETLHQKMGQYGRSGYSLQFQLDTRVSDALRRPLHLNDLIVFDTNVGVAPRRLAWTSREDYRIDLPHLGPPNQFLHAPVKIGEGEWIEYRGVKMGVDPSGRGSDETGWAVVAIAGGMFYLLDFGGFLGGYEDATLEELAKMASRWGVNEVIIESNFGDGMYEKLLLPYLRKHHPCAIEEVRHHTQKEVRLIQALEPVLTQHRLVVSREAMHRDYSSARARAKDVGDRWQQYAFSYQFTRLTKDRDCLAHDDRLEAVAIACAAWQDVMALSKDEALERQVEGEDQDYLRELLETGLLPNRQKISDKKPNWMNTNRGASMLR